MSAWIWLVIAAAAAIGAYLAGWPAWTGFAARRHRDLNTERYLAWRGRAGKRLPDPTLTSRERARLAVAGALALLAVFALVGFFTYA
jgi:hypothetical protein